MGIPGMVVAMPNMTVWVATTSSSHALTWIRTVWPWVAPTGAKMVKDAMPVSVSNLALLSNHVDRAGDVTALDADDNRFNVGRHR